MGQIYSNTSYYKAVALVAAVTFTYHLVRATSPALKAAPEQAPTTEFQKVATASSPQKLGAEKTPPNPTATPPVAQTAAPPVAQRIAPLVRGEPPRKPEEAPPVIAAPQEPQPVDTAASQEPQPADATAAQQSQPGDATAAVQESQTIATLQEIHLPTISEVESDAKEKIKTAAKEHPEWIAEVRSKVQRQPGLKVAEFAQALENRHGSDVVPVLLAIALDRGNAARLRYVAFASATKLRGTSLHPTFRPFLADPDPFIRVEAVRVLSEAETTFQFETLLSSLDDRALVVRNAAVRALRKSRPQDAAKHLIRVLGDSRNFVRGKPLPIIFETARLLIEVGSFSDLWEVCEIPTLMSHPQSIQIRSTLIARISAKEGIDSNKRPSCAVTPTADQLASAFPQPENQQ